jgi:AcrR family transcriptional regulator
VRLPSQRRRTGSTEIDTNGEMATSTIRSGDAGRVQRADARRNHEKVLAAARRQFARCGLDAQMDEIARDAGVGVGTVYRHFPTKEDLLQALADARFEGLAQAGRDSLEAEDPWQGFVEFMTYSARVMAEDRALSEAMDQRPALCGQAADKVEMLTVTGAVVARAQASGQLREDIVAEDVPSLICGLGRSARANAGRPAMSWQRHLDIILAGLRA